MSNCTNVIRTCMSQGLNLLSVGYHGVGKTQMVLEEAKSLELKMKYYSSSTLDPWSDLVGIPVPVDAKGNSKRDGNGMPDRDEALDELTERAQQVFRDWLPTWGITPSGELRTVGEIDKPSNIDWEFILSRRIASSIRLALEERWAPPNRKIAWLYPDVLLPADHEVEQYQNYFLMAIDASGSISRSVLDRFLGVARSIPADRVQLTAISFDTKVYPVDIRDNVPAIRGGGGTSFKAVERFATEQMSRYPDLIVVLTDGYAPRPTVQHPNRWFWLITERGTFYHVEGVGRYCRINCLSSVSANCVIHFGKIKSMCLCKGKSVNRS